MDREVIALLPAEKRQKGKNRPRALVRFADGRMAVEAVESDTTKSGQYLARFRELAPIIDPSTREVIGYELEQVASPRHA